MLHAFAGKPRFYFYSAFHYIVRIRQIQSSASSAEQFGENVRKAFVYLIKLFFKMCIRDRHLAALGHELTEDELERVFSEFKKLCDKKKVVNDFDIEALISQKSESENKYKLDRFDVHAGNHTTATCTIRLSDGENKVIEDVCLGDGPVDAAYNAIDKIINPPSHTLDTYNIRAVSEGKDTLGEVLVRLKTDDNKIYNGRGLSTDIIEASIFCLLYTSRCV